MIPYLREFVKCEPPGDIVNPKDKSYQKAYALFRERLVKARKDVGLTQAEVSARMRRPRTFTSKCELGDRRVDFVELVRLARIYGKDLSFFEVE